VLSSERSMPPPVNSLSTTISAISSINLSTNTCHGLRRNAELQR
jgi:hypothetical protein